MKLRTIVGLAAIGGSMYGLWHAYKQHGGKLTIESFKQTARELLGMAKTEAAELKDRAKKKVIHEVAAKVEKATATP